MSQMFLFGFSSGLMWLWLVLVPVSGWVVLHSWFFRSVMWRAANYNRYFLITLFGVVCVLGGIGLASLKNMYLQDTFSHIWEFPVYMLNAAHGSNADGVFNNYVSVIFWSTPLGLAFAVVVFVFSMLLLFARKIFGLTASVVTKSVFLLAKKNTAAKTVVANIGILLGKGDWLSSDILTKRPVVYNQRKNFLTEKNGIFRLIDDAHKEALPAMLTLSNGKVYIGWVHEISDWNNPEPSKQYLYFLPLYSGYRDSKTMDLEVTTDYDEIYENIGGIVKTVDLEMVIPVHEIIYAQPFDPAVYAAMQAAKRERASKRKTRARRK